MKKTLVKVVFAWAIIAAGQATTSGNNSILSFVNNRGNRAISAAIDGYTYDFYLYLFENLELDNNLTDNYLVSKKIYDESIFLGLTPSLPAEYALSWVLHYFGLGLREEGGTFFITESEIIGDKSQEIAALHLSKDGPIEKQIKETLRFPGSA